MVHLRIKHCRTFFFLIEFDYIHILIFGEQMIMFTKIQIQDSKSHLLIVSMQELIDQLKIKINKKRNSRVIYLVKSFISSIVFGVNGFHPYCLVLIRNCTAL